METIKATTKELFRILKEQLRDGRLHPQIQKAVDRFKEKAQITSLSSLYPFKEMNPVQFENLEELSDILTRHQKILFVANHIITDQSGPLEWTINIAECLRKAGSEQYLRAIMQKDQSSLGVSRVKELAIAYGAIILDDKGTGEIRRELSTTRSHLFLYPEATEAEVMESYHTDVWKMLHLALSQGYVILPVGLYPGEKVSPLRSNRFEHVRFGTPITLQIFRESMKVSGETSLTTEQKMNITPFVLRRVASLIPEHYRGVYDETKMK